MGFQEVSDHQKSSNTTLSGDLNLLQDYFQRYLILMQIT